MNGQKELYTLLEQLHISFTYYEHPPVHTAELALKYNRNDGATHCKNLFFRNHKGDTHYLVIIDAKKTVDIKELEQKLNQGKISFASEHRMSTYLGVKPGSVSLFALMNDQKREVIVFIDENIAKAEKVSFHPNINTASLVISGKDIFTFLKYTQHPFECLSLYAKE